MPSVSRRRSGSVDRSAPVYDGSPTGEVVDWPVSRLSKRITNRPADAMRSQNSGSHQSIEEVAPPISRTAGSPDEPNVSTQSSASPTGTMLTGMGQSVPAGALLVGPGGAGGSVAVTDVAQAPADLGLGIALPVGTGRGHLRARQRLRDAVGGGGRVGGVHVPAGLLRPDVVQAAELRGGHAELRHQRLGQGLWVGVAQVLGPGHGHAGGVGERPRLGAVGDGAT